MSNIADVGINTHRTTVTPLWLSILIPVYDVEPYLRQCVRSIMDQQPGDGIEIILLDDCSQDGSWRVCKELAAQYPHIIRLMQHACNRGLSAARNSMLDAALGEYVWFVDSDDYLLKNSLHQLRDIVLRHHSDVILFDYNKRRSLFKKAFPGLLAQSGTDQQRLLSGVFRFGKLYAWLKISKRELWRDDLRFPIGRAFEDIATIPRLLLRCKSYYYTPKAWIYYRIRPNSIMTSVTRTRHCFDVYKNDDLASAMLGFPETLVQQTKGTHRSTNFNASHFIAKEYCKLARRYDDANGIDNRADTETEQKNCTRPLSNYLEKMENGSPLKFDALRRAYLKRFRLWDYVRLGRAVAMARDTA